MLDEGLPVAAPLEALAPLPEMDRHALAFHCAAVAQHMSALARLFDPAVKTSVEPKKSKKHGADDPDKAARPKRELSAYNVFMQGKLQQVKAEGRGAARAAARAAPARRDGRGGAASPRRGAARAAWRVAFQRPRPAAD